MTGNSRYTIALHVLTWMALVARRGRDLVTSEQIAGSVNTNPVFLRRVLGPLREAGLVSSQRGSGAGWRLARPAAEITLAQVYQAMADQPLFPMHRGEPNPDCPVGHGIRPALAPLYRAAEDALTRQLAGTTIEDLLADTLRQHAAS
ncbi:Rrf2 family transcriptional regulator [Micromonospora sp. NPDC005806]|uniref:Rrf2 family transcriptional regulator n=1 Tax=Micromonospora sp. NPDC005806 TaxID=3364234 RepID=UPI0036AA1B7A